MKKHLPLILSVVGGVGLTVAGYFAGPGIVLMVVLSVLLSVWIYAGYRLLLSMKDF